jgi:RNA polymerase sigma factor (sigma-70 family)
MMRFDTTRWSMVLQARDGTNQARSALETLCRTYRPPVLAYIRRRGYGAETAEDLAQTFFARFIEDAYHANADPARGRFRAFLLTALKRFLIDSDNEAHAAKRGGGYQFKSLEQNTGNGNTLETLADSETPERAFERSWAVTLLDAAMGRLRDEAVKAGKQGLFEQLSEFLTERPDEADYARVADTLKMRRNTLAVAVHRLRHRLRELIREELAQTTTDRTDLESELRDMRVALGAALG